MRILILLISIAAMNACTTREVYEIIRGNERSRCYRLPDTERDRCLQRTADDFDTFERQRTMPQMRPCRDLPESVREVCTNRAVDDLEELERQRADAKLRP